MTTQPERDRLPVESRCETCDRVDCPYLPFAAMGWREFDRHGEVPYVAADDCRAHRVDWRARALAAESRAERAEQDGESYRAELVRLRQVVDDANAGYRALHAIAARAEALLREARSYVTMYPSSRAALDLLARIDAHLAETKE